MISTLVENSLCTCLLTFLQIIIIMTGESTSTASKEMVPRAPIRSVIVLKMKYSLCFVVSYVQPVTQQYESRTGRKAPLQSK